MGTNETIVFQNSTLKLCASNSPRPEVIIETRFYLHSVFGILLTIFGLIGNGLSIVILSKEVPSTSTSVILRALGVADSLYLLSNLMYYPLLGLKYKTSALDLYFIKPYYYVTVYVIKPCMFIFQQISIWLVVLVTVDRFFAVCKPMKALSQCTVKKARRHILIIFIFCIAYNIPRFFEYEVVECYNADKNASSAEIDFPPMTSNVVYIWLYTIALYFLIYNLIPMTCLAVINTKLIMTLRKASRVRAELTGQKQDSDNLTLMLVVVVVVFMVCQIPDFTIQILYFVFKVLNDNHPIEVQLYDMFSAYMLMVNASVNFLIYCVCGKKFRKLMVETLKCASWCMEKKGSLKFSKVSKTDSTSV